VFDPNRVAAVRERRTFEVDIVNAAGITGDRRRFTILKAAAVGDVARQNLLIAVVVDRFVDLERSGRPVASVSATNDVSSTFLYVVVPEMRPDGPGAFGHVPFEPPATKEILRKIERGATSPGRVGRPRSGIWPFGIGWVWANGDAATMTRNATVIANRGVIAASISEVARARFEAPAMFRLATEGIRQPIHDFVRRVGAGPCIVVTMSTSVGPTPGHFHAVRFYENKTSLCRTVADFLAEGFRDHQPVW
jgi:hypothetical protein